MQWGTPVVEADATSDFPAGGRRGEQPAPSLSQGYRAAGILAVVYTFNFLDRQFLSVLAQPVKLDLHLSDTDLGLLTGFAFAVFYTFFGIPVAALADRFNRVRIIALACALWSLFSAACGLSTGFITLAAARIGVGVGEAGGSPPSYSVISDYFPPEKRGLGLALYSLGVPFGTMFGAASGGLIAATLGWRAAFFIVGGLGLLLAPLLLIAVKEPVRGRFDGAGASTRAAGPKPGMLATLLVFASTPKLLFTALSAGLTAFVGYGLLNWTPSFLMREEAMSLQQIALYYSVTLGLAMALGTWASGALVDRLGPRQPAAYALVPGIAMLASLPFFLGVLHAPSWGHALVLLVFPSILNIAYLAPALAVVQNAVRPERRGVAGAVLLFVLNLVGLGGGPLFVGMMSDMYKRAGTSHALTHAMEALAPFFALAFLCQLLAAWFIHKDRRTGL